MRFHAVAETLARTTLGGLPPGDEVNSSRRWGEPLGGHVQGHVDAVGTVGSVEAEATGFA